MRNPFRRGSLEPWQARGSFTRDRTATEFPYEVVQIADLYIVYATTPALAASTSFTIDLTTDGTIRAVSLFLRRPILDVLVDTSATPATAGYQRANRPVAENEEWRAGKPVTPNFSYDVIWSTIYNHWQVLVSNGPAAATRAFSLVASGL